uniref:hypothetical protein n=1 Tax=Segatella hominis TaxID=2518605 RepID=UPI004038AC1A
MAMDKNNFLPYIYINSHYCYSYIDFLETIKAFLNLTLAYEEKEKKLFYWLGPLIDDGVLEAWLQLQGADEAQKLIEILQQKSDAAKGALKIMRHILLTMELI